MGRRSISDQLRLDARGLVRFPAALAQHILAGAQPFASVFVDPAGQRVALVFTRHPQPGSFRLLTPGGHPALYLKGALQAAEISTEPGPLALRQEEQLLILDRASALLPGPWIPFHCRSSAYIPMATLDARGTLTLDRLCVRSLPTDVAASAEASYDAATGFFSLTFSEDGSLAVRRVASHAELSFRGTLTSLGLPLPLKRIRYVAQVQDAVLRFCFKDPFLPIRA